MKIFIMGIAVLCLLSSGAFAETPADAKQAPAPCPMMSGQQSAPGANPHAGHQMPAQGSEVKPAGPMGGMMGGGMMGGNMGSGMMHCPMKKHMGEMAAMLKEVMIIQNAQLKGVSAKEKKAFQEKLAAMMKQLDDMKTAPMNCPMMQNMDHGKPQMAPPPAKPGAPAAPQKQEMPAGHQH